MTLEEMFCDLYDKYGKDFNWYLLPLTQADGAFVVELNKEIGQGHFLSGKKIRAVAKCDSNDDVLYVVRSGIPWNGFDQAKKEASLWDLTSTPEH